MSKPEDDPLVEVIEEGTIDSLPDLAELSRLLNPEGRRKARTIEQERK